jgi:hypothetical protein
MRHRVGQVENLVHDERAVVARLAKLRTLFTQLTVNHSRNDTRTLMPYHCAPFVHADILTACCAGIRKGRCGWRPTGGPCFIPTCLTPVYVQSVDIVNAVEYRSHRTHPSRNLHAFLTHLCTRVKDRFITELQKHSMGRRGSGVQRIFRFR